MNRRTLLAIALFGPLLSAAPVTTVAAQTAPSPSPSQQINVAAAAVAQREAAAKSLVPLLKTVRRKASGQVTAQQGSVPNSPFTGTQTTVFAVTIGKKTVPVDMEVVKAMDQLIGWKIADPNAVAEQQLFDDFMEQLSTKAAALGAQLGTEVGCNTTCVIERMTKLGDVWGGAPRMRPDARDQMMLDAIAAVVKTRK